MQFFKLAAATAVVAGAVDGAADSDSAGAPYQVQPCTDSVLRRMRIGRRPNVDACNTCNNVEANIDRPTWVDCYKKEIKKINSEFLSNSDNSQLQPVEFNDFAALFNRFPNQPHQRPVLSQEGLGSISRMRFGPELFANRPNVVVKSALSDNAAASPCDAPMSTKGMCRALIPGRWTYNKASGKCESFYYGGCGASANFFDSKRDCVRTCENNNKAEAEAEDVDMKGGWGFGSFGKPNGHGFNRQGLNVYGPGGDAPPENDFSLPKCDQDMLKSGLGRAYIPFYSYNKTAKACQMKPYGGFGEKNTDNWFETESECTKKCVHSKIDGVTMDQILNNFDKLKDTYKEELDAVPKVTDYHGCSADNPCKCPKNPGISFRDNKAKVYYWNASHKNCEIMVYKGFNGNANRFETWDSCIDRCHEDPEEAKKEKYGVQLEARTSMESLDPICNEPKAGDNVQFCRALITVYTFDKISGECILSGLGGCDWTTKNSFYRKEDCEDKCVRASTSSSSSSSSSSASGSEIGADGLEVRCHGSFEESYEDAFVTGTHAYKVYDGVKGKCKTVYYLEERLSIGPEENLFVSFPKCRAACEPYREIHG